MFLNKKSQNLIGYTMFIVMYFIGMINCLQLHLSTEITYAKVPKHIKITYH